MPIRRASAVSAFTYESSLHASQIQARDNRRRFNVYNCGRRWGKNVLAEDIAITCAIDPERGGPVGWFAPTYRYLMEAWRHTTLLLKPIARHVSETEKRIELATGNAIEFWSLEDPDAGRGFKYKQIIIDEAAKVPDLRSKWASTLRPTLIDLRGSADFFSTPKGLNDFWRLHCLGDDEEFREWQNFTATTSANPFMSADEIAGMAADMSEAEYAQEILAQFLSDATMVFRNVDACSTSTPQLLAIPHHDYAFGVDWGKYNDFTVISIFDVTERRQVYLERFNNIDYHFQVARLKIAAEKFKPFVILAERNSMGDPIIEICQRQKLPVIPFHTSFSTKARLVEALSLALERETIHVLKNPTQIMELKSFTTERLPSGPLKYTAPSGGHDDCVIALALSYWAACQGNNRIRQRDFAVVA